jgi:hypothetical protein
MQLAREVQAELGKFAQNAGVLLGDVRERRHEQNRNIGQVQSQAF